MATGQPSDSVTSAVSNREIWQRLRNAGRWILPRPLGWRHEDLGRARRHFTWVLAGIASTLVTVLVIGFLIWRLPDAAAGLWLATFLEKTLHHYSQGIEGLTGIALFSDDSAVQVA